MYAVPLAIVGLQLVLIGADAFEISKCFLVASSSSLVGLILCWKCTSCCKPATLVTAGLTIGLVSAFFLLDYKATNSTAEKMETRGKVLTDLMIGLVLTTVGYTVARCGLETQLLQLMPKSQYLCYQGKIVLRQCLGAIIGATWSSLFLIMTESTVASFIPFMIIAAIFIIILLTYLKEKLQPHASQVLKN